MAAFVEYCFPVIAWILNNFTAIMISKERNKKRIVFNRLKCNYLHPQYVESIPNNLHLNSIYCLGKAISGIYIMLIFHFICCSYFFNTIIELIIMKGDFYGVLQQNYFFA